MEIGIDSFAGLADDERADSAAFRAQAMTQLLERIQYADKMGLDVFGIGEHYRKEFMDSAPAVILAAAAGRTQQIKLTSAVAVLSATDPVRTFQQYATLDLVSQGRAEMVVGRGSFTDAFPLFGLNLHDYDELFSERLNLLLQIREEEVINWEGRFRPAMVNQAVYPRPVQDQLPIWLGVGGTPASFVRAGRMGLPLMVAVIGGQTHRFRPLVDLYREAGMKAGHAPETLKVGLHSLGFVGDETQQTLDTYFPGYAKMFNKIGQERGWPPVTRMGFNAQVDDMGALVIGSPEYVAEKIIRHSESLGGVNRFSFQMDNAGLTHDQLMHAIELIGTKVKPLVLEMLQAAPNPS